MAGPRGCAWHQQRTQGRQADRVEGAQRHPVLRQFAQRCGHAVQACCPRFSMAQATASLRSLAWNTPLIARRWLFRPSSRNSTEVRAASAMAPGRAGSPGRPWSSRIAQRVECGLEANLLHLQARVRAEAGGTAVVALQEAGPGLGQAEQPQGVPGRRRVEDDVVPGLRRRRPAGTRTRRRMRSRSCRHPTAARAPSTVPPRSRWLPSAPAPAGGRTRPRCRGRCSAPTGPVRPGTGTGVLRNAMPEHLVEVRRGIGADEQHLLAGVGQVSAAAVDSEVLPTPPLPVKKRCRVGWSTNPMRAGLNQACTASSREGCRRCAPPGRR
jgi:hypothetical protein